MLPDGDDGIVDGVQAGMGVRVRDTEEGGVKDLGGVLGAWGVEGVPSSIETRGGSGARLGWMAPTLTNAAA